MEVMTDDGKAVRALYMHEGEEIEEITPVCCYQTSGWCFADAAYGVLDRFGDEAGSRYMHSVERALNAGKTSGTYGRRHPIRWTLIDDERYEGE